MSTYSFSSELPKRENVRFLSWCIIVDSFTNKEINGSKNALKMEIVSALDIFKNKWTNFLLEHSYDIRLKTKQKTIKKKRFSLFKFSFALSLICHLANALYGPINDGGNGTYPLLATFDNQYLPNVHVNVSLEDVECGLIPNPYENLGDVIDNITDYSEIVNITYYNYNLNELSNVLRKRKDIHSCITWVRGVRQCVNNVWDGLVDVWGIAYKIKQLATAKQCTEIHGQIGGTYYRYWAAGGDCNTTAEQKTIAGAIHAAIKAQSGDWLCNTFCITMTHGGTWTGTLLIGTDESVYTSNCGGEFKGCYDAGCGALEGWYSCKS